MWLTTWSEHICMDPICEIFLHPTVRPTSQLHPDQLSTSSNQNLENNRIAMELIEYLRTSVH